MSLPCLMVGALWCAIVCCMHAVNAFQARKCAFHRGESSLSLAAGSPKKKLAPPLGADDEAYIKLFGQWYQQAISTLHQSDPNGSLVKIELPNDFAIVEGELRNKPVTFSCEAHHSSKLAYLRRVSFHGDGFHALNIMALPRPSYNIPILGIDIVVLPGKFQDKQLIKLEPLTSDLIH